MNGDEYEELVRRYVDEVWNEGVLDTVDDLFADAWIVHSSSYEHVEDAADLKRHVRSARAAFPDLEMAVEFTVAEDDMVATGIRIAGTHEGDLRGIDPTGERVDVSGIMAHRFEDGVIVESWIDWDSLTLLQQIGAVPEELRPAVGPG